MASPLPSTGTFLQVVEKGSKRSKDLFCRSAAFSTRRGGLMAI
jgi:hypothetical protein